MGDEASLSWYLSDLDCTHANVTEKANSCSACAETGSLNLSFVGRSFVRGCPIPPRVVRRAPRSSPEWPSLTILGSARLSVEQRAVAVFDLQLRILDLMSRESIGLTVVCRAIPGSTRSAIHPRSSAIPGRSRRAHKPAAFTHPDPPHISPNRGTTPGEQNRAPPCLVASHSSVLAPFPGVSGARRLSRDHRRFAVRCGGADRAMAPGFCGTAGVLCCDGRSISLTERLRPDCCMPPSTKPAFPLPCGRRGGYDQNTSYTSSPPSWAITALALRAP